MSLVVLRSWSDGQPQKSEQLPHLTRTRTKWSFRIIKDASSRRKWARTGPEVLGRTRLRWVKGIPRFRIPEHQSHLYCLWAVLLLPCPLHHPYLNSGLKLDNNGSTQECEVTKERRCRMILGKWNPSRSVEVRQVAAYYLLHLYVDFQANCVKVINGAWDHKEGRRRRRVC